MAAELLTAVELAERLKVKPETVRTWAIKKIIPSIRANRKFLRFDLGAVIQALNSSKGDA